MTTITFTKLMQNCQDGKMEVTAWAGNYAEVIVYPAETNKRPTRKQVEVVKVPADFQK